MTTRRLKIDPESIEQDLQRMFEEFEGPPEPVARPRRRRARARVKLGVIAAGAACIAAAVFGVVLSTRDDPVSRPTGARSAACADAIVFAGRSYEAHSLADRRLSAGSPLGKGTVPACRDFLAPEDLSPPGSDESIEVTSIEGVDPRVAVFVENRAGFAYLVAGRCNGAPTADCLARPLSYDGRIYTKTEPVESLAPSASIGAGVLEGAVEEAADVLRISGVEPERAVAVSGEPGYIYVSSGTCTVGDPVAFIACLRGDGASSD